MKKKAPIILCFVLLFCFLMSGCAKENNKNPEEGEKPTSGATKTPTTAPTGKPKEELPGELSPTPPGQTEDKKEFPVQKIPKPENRVHGTTDYRSDKECVTASYVKNNETIYEYFPFSEDFHLFFEETVSWNLNLNGQTILLKKDLLNISNVTVENGTIHSDAFSILNNGTFLAGQTSELRVETISKATGIVNYGTLLLGNLILDVREATGIENYGILSEADSMLLRYDNMEYCRLTMNGGYGIKNHGNLKLRYITIESKAGTACFNDKDAAFYAQAKVSVENGTAFYNAKGGNLRLAHYDEYGAYYNTAESCVRVNVQNGTAYRNFGTMKASVLHEQQSGKVLVNEEKSEFTQSVYSTLSLTNGTIYENHGKLTVEGGTAKLAKGKLCENYSEAEMSSVTLFSNADEIYTGTFVHNHSGATMSFDGANILISQSKDAVAISNEGSITKFFASVYGGYVNPNSEFVNLEEGKSQNADGICEKTTLLKLAAGSKIENFLGNFGLNATDTEEVNTASGSTAIRLLNGQTLILEQDFVPSVKLFGKNSCGILVEKGSCFGIAEAVQNGIHIDCGVEFLEQKAAGCIGLWNLGTIKTGTFTVSTFGVNNTGIRNEGGMQMLTSGSEDGNGERIKSNLFLYVYGEDSTGLQNLGEVSCENVQGAVCGKNSTLIHNETVIDIAIGGFSVDCTREVPEKCVILENKNRFSGDILNFDLYSGLDCSLLNNEGSFQYTSLSTSATGTGGVLITNTKKGSMVQRAMTQTYARYLYADAAESFTLNVFGEDMTGIINEGSLTGGVLELTANQSERILLLHAMAPVQMSYLSCTLNHCAQYRGILNDAAITADNIRIHVEGIARVLSADDERARKTGTSTVPLTYTESIALINSGTISTGPFFAGSTYTKSALLVQNNKDASLHCSDFTINLMGSEDTVGMTNEGELSGETLNLTQFSKFRGDDLSSTGYYKKAHFSNKRTLLENHGTVTATNLYLNESEITGGTAVDNYGKINVVGAVSVVFQSPEVTMIKNRSTAELTASSAYLCTELGAAGGCALSNDGTASLGDATFSVCEKAYCLKNTGTVQAGVVSVSFLEGLKQYYYDNGGVFDYRGIVWY